MFWFVAALFCLIIMGACFAVSTRFSNGGEDGWTIFGGFWAFFAIVAFVIGAFYSMSQRSDQIYDIESVKMYTVNTAILEKKADELTAQFTKDLAEIYPQLEKDIFKSISPDKVGIYLAKYPELQSSKTVMALVENISKLQTDRYNQELAQQGTLRDIRFRLNNPWALSWLIPRTDLSPVGQ